MESARSFQRFDGYEFRVNVNRWIIKAFFAQAISMNDSPDHKTHCDRIL